MIHRFPTLFAAFFGHANIPCDEWEGALREAKPSTAIGVDFGKRGTTRFYRIRETPNGNVYEEVYG